MDPSIIFVCSVDTSDTSTERSHSDDSHSTSSTTSSPSTEVEQPRVQVYDHGNRFESRRPIHARVERMFPHAHEVSYVCVQILA
jgi:hypothetical protein